MARDPRIDAKIAEAKPPEARSKPMARAIAMLTAGRKRYEKYQDC
jgi:hypothetical protein